MTTDTGSEQALMGLAGVLVAMGALMMLAKGVVLIATENDRSLVPWFGLFTGLGFTAAALALWRSTSRLRWLTAVGGGLALIGVAASLVAIIYLVTGTIPESENAPVSVGGSYISLSAGGFLSLLALGIVIAANRSLAGRWRWLPLGLLAAQLPIFIIAGAIGDTIGSENVTDGLGLALTGAAWLLLGYAFSRQPLPGAATASKPPKDSMARSTSFWLGENALFATKRFGRQSARDAKHWCRRAGMPQGHAAL